MNTRERAHSETSLTAERWRQKSRRRRSEHALVRSRPAVPVEANHRLHGNPPGQLREQHAGPQRGPKRSLPIIVAATALVAVGAYSGLSSSGSVSTESAPQAALGLNVSHTNSGLRLVWNPSAPLLRGALKAELTINDGDRLSRVFLSPGQIRSGNLAYTPVTGDVRFSLRTESGDRAATETVLALEAPSVAYNAVALASRTAADSRLVPRTPPQPTPPATLPPGALIFPAAFSTDLRPDRALAPPAATEKFASYGRRLADLAHRVFQRDDRPH